MDVLKKTLLILLLLAIPCFGQTKDAPFYYIVPSDGTYNSATDPARQFVDKYNKGSWSKVFMGAGVAAIMIECKTRPVVTEPGVIYETVSNLEKVTDKRLINSGFNATDFINAKSIEVSVSP